LAEETNFKKCVMFLQLVKDELAKGEHNEMGSFWEGKIYTNDESLDKMISDIQELEARWNSYDDEGESH
jgi:hypothetical protein